MRERSFVRRAVRRFMPGEALEDAMRAAAEFGPAGIGTILTELGEQVETLAEAQAVRDHYLGVLDQIKSRGLPAQVSVKLSHLGLDQDPARCLAFVQALAERAEARKSFLWLDMEESWYVDRTIEMYRKVRAEHVNVGIALQAYLRRTPQDVDALLSIGPAIRLVKGAYNEPANVAFPRKADVDAQYFTLATKLLEAAKGARARPTFGTHDLPLIARIQGEAERRGVGRDLVEFAMLYGIRAPEQRAIAKAGWRMRVLISYGSAWFAWYMRRLAERPANVWFVVRSLF
jgi:proline dehydrogenase